MTGASIGAGARRAVEHVEGVAERSGKRAAAVAGSKEPSKWLERGARLGYAVRGALYVTVGMLALAVAAGAGGQVTTTKGAIGTIGTLPFGRVLLVLIAIGLAGYGLWGFIRAFLDPMNRGDDAGGLAQRVGYVASGLAYSSLVLPTAQLAMGGSSGHGGPPLAETILQYPGGRWLVAGIGVVWIVGAGFGQLYQAYSASFRKDFESWRMGHEQMRLATIVGRAGLAARGVVFALMGWFLVVAALHADANQAKGVDGALQVLAAQPYGPLLLGAIAAGLACFGAYSICCAFWLRVRV
jgi:hypothetical protein